MMGILRIKVILSLIIGIGMIGTSWFLLSNDGSVLDSVEQLLAAGSAEEANDSDNDGLPDWEEPLFGANPYNKDSDGDRITDGEQFVSLKDIPDVGPTDSALNYLNQVGQALNNGGQVTLPEATLKIPPDHFTVNDIHIVPTTEDGVVLYTYQVLYAISAYRDVIESDTLELVNKWIETNDERDLETITTLSTKHKDLSSLLAGISVPDELASNHLNLVNSIYQSGQALEDVDITTHNPQAGFFAAALYANFQSKRSEAILHLTEYFNEHIPSDNQG